MMILCLISACGPALVVGIQLSCQDLTSCNSPRESTDQLKEKSTSPAAECIDTESNT